MSSLIYNGVAFAEPVTILEYRHTPIYNGPDYLYTEYYIRIRAYLNARSTAFPKGASPADTEGAISSLLVSPRQALTLVNGATIISRVGADANNGPLPQLFSVTEFHGDGRTWEVEFGVTTWLNELTDTSALLSNRWTMEQDIDQDWYTTRVVRGRAVFNRAQLGSASPDSFRDKLLLPVPINFKRDSIQIMEDADGSALDYTVIDREQPINLVAPGVTRIEATNTMGIRNPGIEGSVINLLQATNTILGDVLGSANAEAANPLGDIGGSAIGSAIGIGVITARASLAAGLAIYNNMPKSYGVMAVRVWGQKGTSKSSLSAVAQKIILSRVSLAKLAFARTDAHITEDVAGRFVEVGVSYECGPAATLVSLGAGAGQTLVNVSKGTTDLAGAIKAAKDNAIAFAFPPFPATDDIAGVFQTADAPGLAPPNDDGTRGTFIGQLFAAALLPPGQSPGDVNVPGNIQ